MREKPITMTGKKFKSNNRLKTNHKKNLDIAMLGGAVIIGTTK